MTSNSTNPSDPFHGQDLLEQILEVTSDGVFDWDIPSGTTYFSPQYYRMLGYEIHEFPENVQGWRDLIHPDDLARTEQAVHQHLARPDTPYRVEFRMRQKDGTWKWVLARGKVVEFQPDGSPLRMIGTHVDISERKQAQDRYQQLFENLASAFALHEAILDESGNLVDYRFLEVNPAFEAQTGLQAGLIVGKRVREMIPQVDPSWLERYGSVVATGKPLHYEDFAAPLKRWYEVQVYRPVPGQFAIIMTDITERKLQEFAMQRSEEHFRLLADNSLDSVLRISTTGEYLWISPSIKTILGLDPDSLVGTSSLSLIHPDDIPLVIDSLKNAMGTSEPQKVVFRHVTAEGRVVWLESIGKALRDPVTGEATEILVSSRDITERKLAKDRYQQLFENLTTGFALHEAICDGTGKMVDYRFLEVNPAYEKLTGLLAHDIVGKTVLEVIPGLESYWIEKFGAVVRTGESLRYENFVAAFDRWYETWVYLASPGRFAVMVTEITERKFAERKVLEMNDSLEQRVAERTQELQMAVDELESFSYTISHDLRSPLRAIDGFSQALLEDASDRLDPESKVYLQRIRLASTRMAHLIDDLLELSRSSRLPIRRQEVDATALAHDLLADLQAQEPGRKLTASVAGGIVFDADPVLMRSIMENLLGNAWKYTATRSEAIIDVSSEIIEGRRWLQVRDNGIGFDMAHASKLFGTFQRLHSDPHFEGTGIGLATVRKLVERHGGSLTGNGIPDQGATFRFTLDPVPSA